MKCKVVVIMLLFHHECPVPNANTINLVCVWVFYFGEEIAF